MYGFAVVIKRRGLRCRLNVCSGEPLESLENRKNYDGTKAIHVVTEEPRRFIVNFYRSVRRHGESRELSRR
jgi:hypothetical protein